MLPWLRIFPGLLVFLGMASPGISAQALTPAPQNSGTIPLARIPRVVRAPKIEDFLQDRPREAELVVSGFRQYSPGDGTPASEPTVAYLSYDEKNLYVVFVSHDQPGTIRAHLSKREDLDQDDGVGILLDTFRDFHRAYYFYSNPLGVQYDAIYTEGQNYDSSFDTLWYSQGRVLNDGYIVWFSIPFKSLRFSHAEEQTWGIALYRVILRKSEYDYWPYLTQRVEGITQQFAPLKGIEKVSPGRNMQFIPYGMLASDHFLNQPSPPYSNFTPKIQNEFEHRAGLDAKLIAKDALTFDFTLNPDFSQVETDDPQVTINQRYAVFFPEKRPFFIENAGFFSTPVDLFFSRQIADPQFGARMTGKIGNWTLGALAIDDRAPGQGFTSGPFDTRAIDGVVRVTREFGRQSYLGAFVSSRDFADTNNRIASLDTRLKLSQNWVVDFQAAHSWTRQDAGAPLTCLGYFPNSQGISSQQGNLLYADASYTGRHFTLVSQYNDLSPGFCSELGFITRVNIRQNYTYGGYFWRPQSKKVVDFGPLFSETVDWDHAGVLQDWQAALGFQLDLTKQTTLSISRGESYELFDGIGFRKHSTSVFGSTAPYKWLSFTARYTHGTGENYYPATTLNPYEPFLANSRRINFGFTIRPSSRFRFDETFIYYRLGTREGSTPAGFEPNHSIFNNYLTRTKFNYQFTREFSLRLILDYNATLANPGLVDLQTNLGSYDGGPVVPTKQFTPDILFTYLLHPGTAVYVGYSDSYNNLFLNNVVTPPAVGYQRSPTESNGRLFFVKLSYLLRF